MKIKHFTHLLLGWLLFFQLLPLSATTLTVENLGGSEVVSSLPTGIQCGNNCTADYPQDTIVQLQAVFNSTTHSIRWSGHCLGQSNPTYVILDRDKVCQVQFETLPLDSYELAIIKTQYGQVTSEDGGIQCGQQCVKNYDKGTQINLQAKADESAQFLGWEGACGGSNPQITLTIDAAKACVARFKLKPLELKIISANGGQIISKPTGIQCGNTCSALYDVGQTIELTATPDSNYQFTGWGIDCEGQENPLTVTVDRAKTCTATFELGLDINIIGQGQVTSEPGGIACQTEQQGDCQAHFGAAQQITLTAEALEDYQFSQWQGDCQGQDPQLNLTLDTSKQCTALFERYLQISTVGQGTVTSSPSGIDCGERCQMPITDQQEIELTAQAATGYQFTHWEGDCAGSTDPNVTLTLENSKHCTAHFGVLLIVEKLGQGTGEIQTQPAGLICPEDVMTCQVAFSGDEPITLQANPRIDSEFAGWDGDCESTDLETLVTLDQAKTCQAHFIPLPPTDQQNLTILSWGGTGTVTSEPAGIICGNECSAPFDENLGVLLTVKEDQEARFLGWEGNCSGTDTATSVTIAQDLPTICIARFEKLPPKFDVTVQIQGGNGTIDSIPKGISCGSDCLAFPENTQVAFTLTPDPDSLFLGWSGHCSGTAPTATLFIDKAGKKCTAHLELKPTVNLTVQTTGHGNVTSQPTGLDCQQPECIQAFYQGANLTLTATPQPDSTFVNWGGDCVGNGNQATVTLDTAKTCQANFTLKPTYSFTVEKTGTGQGNITSEPAGLDCGNRCNLTTYQDATFTLTAIPDLSSQFIAWTGDCQANTNVPADAPAQTTVTLTANTTCIAQFDLLPPLSLTVQKFGTGTGRLTAPPGRGQGIDCGEVCVENYNIGSQVILTAQAESQSLFIGWRGDCQGTDPSITLSMTETAKTCTALFHPVPPAGQHLVSLAEVQQGKVISRPEGINCEPHCVAAYPNNTVLTLEATPETGYLFTHWSGDCTGTEPLLGIPINQPLNCGAHFFSIPTAGYQLLTVTQQGKGHLASLPDPNSTTDETTTGNLDTDSKTETPSLDCGDRCTAVYAQGSVVSIQAVADPDFVFTGWQCVGTVTPASNTLILDNPLTVTVDERSICTAHFDPTPSTLQFAIPSYFFNEFAGEAVLIVTRAASNAGLISVDYATQDGTAIAGQDYQSRTGTLTWLDGDTAHKTIHIPLIADDLAEEDKVFRVLLSNPTNKATISNGTAQVTLIDTPPSGAGLLQFTAGHYTVDEKSRELRIGVQRLGGQVGATSVQYSTLDQVATAGTDYTAQQGTLNWREGEAGPQFFTIPILQDNLSEKAETFLLNLSSPTGDSRLGAIRSATVTVLDSLEQADFTAGIFQFTQGTYQGQEGELARLSVTRTQGNQGQVTVSYGTQPLTAQAGLDYSPIDNATLTWLAGDSSPKEITISLLADNITESEESLSVYLSNPVVTGLQQEMMASLGSLSTASVRLLDSLGTPTTIGPDPNAPGILELVADNYQVSESAGSITITVARIGGSQGVVEVDYITEDGTAKTSRDYLSTRGTLRWLDGDSQNKQFEIGLLDNGLVEEDRYLTIRLLNPKNTQLGGNAEAILTLVDDDATTLQFSSTTYAVNENRSQVIISVTREGGNIGQVSAWYEMEDLTAKAGPDYVASTGLLTWVSGDRTPKTFTVTILDDQEVEGNEQFLVRLASVEGNASFGDPEKATVMIIENDSGVCEPPIIDCFYVNEGILTDVKITPLGTVSGGQLGGIVVNEGVIEDVTFLPKTQVNSGLERGVIRGMISSDPVERAVLNQMDIVAEAQLTQVIIGRGSRLDSQVELGAGVCFEDNSSVPSIKDLESLLGRMTTPYLPWNAMRLTGDVLCYNPGGIVETINGLYELRNWDLSQNAKTGYLEVDIGDYHYAVLPLRVRQILWRQVDKAIAMGMLVSPEAEITFITKDSREVVAVPVVQSPLSLQTALDGLQLGNWTMLENGNLRVGAAKGHYYSARPNLFTSVVSTELPLGLDAEESLWLDKVGTVFLIFEAVQNSGGMTNLSNISSLRRKQYFYPTAADPESLYSLSEESQTILELDGRAFIYVGNGTNKQRYQGVLDYLVRPGTGTGQVNFVEAGDVNEDGIADYDVVFPNGDRQWLYGLP